MEITGPAGRIDADYQAASATPIAQAVLCHPHPQYGGNMHDAVLDCAATVLLDAGVGVLRFNFRGVGRSAGSYDGGRGELDDLLAAVAWLQQAYPNQPLWLGGYSFGAHVAWQASAAASAAAAAAAAAPQRVLLLAPPIGAMPFPAHQPHCRVDVFAGDSDQFIDQPRLAAWAEADVHLIPGADHFFTGKTAALAEQIREALQPSSDDAHP
ncbi:MAG: alpha/beta hydrolase [Pseudomonadales bacterium]